MIGAIISNCINTSIAIIQGVSNVGGICGYQEEGNIDNCTNEGTIDATSSIAGGIAGYSAGNITSCKNKGNVTSQGCPENQVETQGTGGIAGRLDNNANISMSSNMGKIKASTGYFVGGIVGLGEGGTKISECFNYNGNIEAIYNGVGGIAGRSEGITFINCYNYLETNNYYIKAEGINSGGIVGVVANSTYSTSKTLIQNSYNIGENITSNTGAGGIIGNTGYETEAKNCYYLNTSTLVPVGSESVALSVKDIVTKIQTLFKSLVTNTSSVAYLLNENKTSGVWSQDDSINDGYPYLVNNVPE